MNKITSVIISVLFIGGMSIYGLTSWITTDRLTSDIENRSLSQKPEVSKKGLLSGDFFDDFESYYNDQLFKRDLLIKTYTLFQLEMQKTIINGVVIGEDGWLMEEPTTLLEKSKLKASLEQINELASYTDSNEVSLYLALAPHKKNVLSNKYPSYLNMNIGNDRRNYFVKKLDSRINYINLAENYTDLYSADELEDMYFKTDHHWNFKGALNSYPIIISKMNNVLDSNTKEPIKDYTIKCNNNAKFVGSYSKKLFKLVDSDSEYQCGYYPDDLKDLTEFSAINSKGKILSSFSEVFGSKMSNREVTYAGLSSPDMAEIHFHYENRNNAKLLILKDSYANAIVPFLAQHFSDTYVLNLRDYKEKSVYQYIEDNDINTVLILYNDSNLTGEMYSFD